MADLATELLSASFAHREPQVDVRPGDRARSYDFAGIHDCYVEGVVQAITPAMQGCARYEVLVQRRIVGGKEVPTHETVVYPPVKGTPTWLGTRTNLVEKL